MRSQVMSVRVKLGLSFALLALLVMAICLLALNALDSTNKELGRFVDGVNARALLAAQVRTAVDRRAIAARNLVLVTTDADLQLEKAEVLSAHEDVRTRLARLQELAKGADVPPQARQIIAELANIEQQYAPVALAIVDLALKGQRDAAIARMNTDCRPLLAALAKTSEQFSEYTAGQARDTIAETARHYASQRLLMFAVCFVAVVAAVVAGLLITRSLYRALGAEPGELGAVARQVANGDLTPSAALAAAPSGSVLAMLGTMQDSLSGIVSQVRAVSGSIVSGSGQIADGSVHLSERTEQQASALQQTAATMSQLGTTVRTNTSHAAQANQLGQNASELATQGGQAVVAVVEKMRAINDSSRKISDITGVIDSIAFQTNILALNAAVEAARAGEQGRGFAVVAGEVRSLAQRSAEAAREIKALISASVEEAEQGYTLADEAGRTMTNVVEAIQRVGVIVSEISNATSEQNTGVDEVGQAITQIDQATQRNAALVEESAAAAQNLRVHADSLVKAVEAFRLPAAANSANRLDCA